jgi:ubiquitin carboxyl-terminal hydrolase 7
LLTATPRIESLPDPTIATVPKYFDQLRNRQVVVFKPKSKEKEPDSPDVELILSKKMVYDVIVEKLGGKLNADPLKIRLSTNAALTNKQYIKRSPTLTLQEMLHTGFYNPLPTPCILFYEVLEIPLSELEFKRYLKISHIDHQGKEQVVN